MNPLGGSSVVGSKERRFLFPPAAARRYASRLRRILAPNSQTHHRTATTTTAERVPNLRCGLFGFSSSVCWTSGPAVSSTPLLPVLGARRKTSAHTSKIGTADHQQLAILDIAAYVLCASCVRPVYVLTISVATKIYPTPQSSDLLSSHHPPQWRYSIGFPGFDSQATTHLHSNHDVLCS